MKKKPATSCTIHGLITLCKSPWITLYMLRQYVQ